MYHIKKKKLQTLVSRLLALGRAADSEFCLGIVLSVNLEKCYKGYQKPILLFITRLSLKRLIKSSPYHCLIQRYYHSYFASEEKAIQRNYPRSHTWIQSLFTLKSTECFPLYHADCLIYPPHVSSRYICWI